MISKNVEICSLIVFPRCSKVKIYLIFAEISTEQISIVLIIPKHTRRIALTNANAKSTLCAGSGAAVCFFNKQGGRGDFLRGTMCF